MKDYDFEAQGSTSKYPMVWTVEGYAVHQGLGCTGEAFRGPLSCKHSKENTVTQAVQRYESKVPERIDFSDEQLRTITDVICVDSQGNRAPPAFVQLFLASCRHTGLDPFLRQIYALNLKGKWTMYVGVDGYRVVSARTGLDDGIDGPQWSDDGEKWFDYPSDEPAHYCRVGIWRKGVPRAYVAVVNMKVKYNAASQSWKEDPNGMLAKCAEILARRRAFPADMAVLDDISVDIEDADGAQVTRAEVPQGEYREIEQEAPQEPVQAPPRPAPDKPAPTPQDELTRAYMNLVEDRGPIAGKAVMDWAEQTFPHAKPAGKPFKKSLLTPAELDRLIAEVIRLRVHGVPCENDDHSWVWSEDATYMECERCHVAQPIEDDDTVAEEQPAMI